MIITAVMHHSSITAEWIHNRIASICIDAASSYVIVNAKERSSATHCVLIYNEAKLTPTWKQLTSRAVVYKLTTLTSEKYSCIHSSRSKSAAQMLPLYWWSTGQWETSELCGDQSAVRKVWHVTINATVPFVTGPPACTEAGTSLH